MSATVASGASVRKWMGKGFHLPTLIMPGQRKGKSNQLLMSKSIPYILKIKVMFFRQALSSSKVSNLLDTHHYFFVKVILI